MLRSILVSILAPILLAAPAAALTPQPGDVYFVTAPGTGSPEVHHVAAGSSGATTLVARGGYLAAHWACCLTVAADGRLWLIQSSSNPEPGRLLRIDPTAFDPGNPIANQELVLQGSPLLQEPGALAAVPAPLSASVAAVPPWFAGLAAALITVFGIRARRRGITKAEEGC